MAKETARYEPGDAVMVPPSPRTSGGLATVSHSEGNFLAVAEVPDWCYHADYLRVLQPALRKRFGESPAGPHEDGQEDSMREPVPQGLF